MIQCSTNTLDVNGIVLDTKSCVVNELTKCHAN